MELFRMILKLMIRLLLFPLIVALTFLQWAGIIAASLSKTVTNIVSAVFFMLAIAGYLINRSLAMQAVNVAVVAAGIFSLPYIAKWICYWITDLNFALQKLVRS